MLDAVSDATTAQILSPYLRTYQINADLGVPRIR